MIHFQDLELLDLPLVSFGLSKNRPGPVLGGLSWGSSKNQLLHKTRSELLQLRLGTCDQGILGKPQLS